MPLQLQFRRGTTAQNTAFTGAVGEVSIDTDLKTLRVHDGSTPGGFSVVNASSTQTMSNKTLTLPTISTINNSGTLTLPTGPDTVVGRASTDTLTNKTLTLPTISSINNGGTLTLPTGPDTVVGRATVDTLTNKTLTAPFITGGSFKYTISGQSLAANRTIQLPVITGDDAFVLTTATQTLVNKTLNGAYLNDPTFSGTVNGNVTFQGNIQTAYTAIVGYDIPNKTYVDNKALVSAIGIAAAFA